MTTIEETLALRRALVAFTIAAAVPREDAGPAGRPPHCRMNSQRLHTRLAFWTEKLTIVERAMAVELRKHYRSRRPHLLLFLHREKSICTNIIAELSTLADDANTTAGR